MAELVKKGFLYKNEDGEENIIKRSEINIEEYKYTKEQNEVKKELMYKCISQFPDMDKSTINILVDYHMNHPEKLEEECRSDNDYLKLIGEYTTDDKPAFLKV